MIFFILSISLLISLYKGLNEWRGVNKSVKLLYVLATSWKGVGGSKYIKLLYIQNTEIHVQNSTNVPVFFIWRWDLNPLLGPLEGVGPSTGPCNGCCPHQSHYVLRHINNRYINS
jgi:hypothetical protein